VLRTGAAWLATNERNKKPKQQKSGGGERPNANESARRHVTAVKHRRTIRIRYLERKDATTKETRVQAKNDNETQKPATQSSLALLPLFRDLVPVRRDLGLCKYRDNHLMLQYCIISMMSGQ